MKTYSSYFKAKLLFLSYSTKHPHICTLKRSPRCLTVTFDCGWLSSGFFLSTTDLTDRTDSCPVRGRNRSKSLSLSPGLCPCSLMRMLSHVSELPCLITPICLVCPMADGKASKQNSCRRQNKMSLFRGY